MLASLLCAVSIFLCLSFPEHIFYLVRRHHEPKRKFSINEFDSMKNFVFFAHKRRINFHVNVAIAKKKNKIKMTNKTLNL